jgi:hypothetical protein
MIMVNGRRKQRRATFLSRFASLTPVIERIAQLWRSLLVVLME